MHINDGISRYRRDNRSVSARAGGQRLHARTHAHTHNHNEARSHNLPIDARSPQRRRGSSLFPEARARARSPFFPIHAAAVAPHTLSSKTNAGSRGGNCSRCSANAIPITLYLSALSLLLAALYLFDCNFDEYRGVSGARLDVCLRESGTCVALHLTASAELFKQWKLRFVNYCIPARGRLCLFIVWQGSRFSDYLVNFYNCWAYTVGGICLFRFIAFRLVFHNNSLGKVRKMQRNKSRFRATI